MSGITPKEMSLCPKQFYAMWELWKWKGHKPSEKLRIFEVPNGDSVLYSVAVLDYGTLETWCFPNEKVYKNYAQAFAAVGRALDAGDKAAAEKTAQ